MEQHLGLQMVLDSKSEPGHPFITLFIHTQIRKNSKVIDIGCFALQFLQVGTLY